MGPGECKIQIEKSSDWRQRLERSRGKNDLIRKVRRQWDWAGVELSERNCGRVGFQKRCDVRGGEGFYEEMRSSTTMISTMRKEGRVIEPKGVEEIPENLENPQCGMAWLMFVLGNFFKSRPILSRRL